MVPYFVARLVNFWQFNMLCHWLPENMSKRNAIGTHPRDVAGPKNNENLCRTAVPETFWMVVIWSQKTQRILT
jgi:hypothetical protein